MRIINFAKRNFKELIRDPLSLIFEIALPIFLLIIFQQFNIPDEAYKLSNFTPGIIIFGFSFISLFTATLIAKDRSSSLLIRLGTSPMKSSEYILGYILSIIPIIIIQDILFFIVAILLGLEFSFNIILAIIISLIVSILFISLGILIGSLVSDKATGGLGSLIVQLVCFTSGMYFSKDLVGKGFALICELLPYTILIVILSVIVFKNKMTSDNK